MHIPYKVVTSREYFDQLDKEIDWDDVEDCEENPKFVTVEEANLIDKILSCEAAVYVLHRSTGVDGGNVDTMVNLRRELITKYEETFNTKYTYPNEEDYYK